MNCNTANDINTKPAASQQHRSSSLVSNDDFEVDTDLDSDILDQVLKSGGDNQFNMLNDLLDGSDLVLDNDVGGGSIDILLDEVLDGDEGLVDIDGHEQQHHQLDDTKSDNNNSQDLLEDMENGDSVLNLERSNF